ncbi:G-D-S-L family lipolytic protein, partial [Streptomyces sp. DJ]
QAVSDPAPFAVPAGAQLLVSIHLPGPVEAAPVHAHALRTSWISPPGSGDRTADTGAKAFTGTLKTWPFLTGVDVSSPSPRSARGSGTGAVVTLGDSITDGVGSTADADNRWPDVLSRRLLGADRPPVQSVLNHGISANRIVTDRYLGDGVSRITGGVSAQNRLERDVLSQPGVRTVVVFEGINDLRAGTSPEEVAAGLRAVAERARA